MFDILLKNDEFANTVLEVDDDWTVAELKHRIGAVYAAEIEQEADFASDIQLVYYGRRLADGEKLHDVVRAQLASPGQSIIAFHFTVSRSALVVGAGSGVGQAPDRALDRAADRLAGRVAGRVADASPESASESAPAETSPAWSPVHTLHDGPRAADRSADWSTDPDTCTRFFTVSLRTRHETVTVSIPSSHCILVDTGDHQPYVLLSKTAAARLESGLGIRLAHCEVRVVAPTARTDHRGLNSQFRDTGINRWYDWRRPVEDTEGLFNGIRVFGFDFHNVSWAELPLYLHDRIDQFLRHFMRTVILLASRGSFTRMFMAVVGLCKYFVVLEIFNFRYALKERHAYIYMALIWLCVVVTVLDGSNSTNLREILTRDLHDFTGRATSIAVLNSVRDVKTRLNHVYSSINSNIVLFAIGNNRPGLVLNDHGHVYQHGVMRLVAHDPDASGFKRFATIALQDVVCFFATLIPRFYIVFNYEMVKRISKVDQEQMEREHAQLAQDAPDAPDVADHDSD